MKRNNKTEHDRRRVADAALSRLKRKTGDYYQLITLPDGMMYRKEITPEYMLQLLIGLENQAREEFGVVEGDKVIRASYDKAIIIDKYGERLSEIGKAIIEDAFEESARHEKEKYVSGGIN